ncbi:hypothetical protein Tco_1432807 [Tanacetum coccineum]
MDTAYGRRWILRIGNCEYAFSCEDLALIRRISFPGYGVLVRLGYYGIWRSTNREILISHIYYVEGLGHNLFSGGQFCDSYPEVTLRKHTCFLRNLEGVDLLSGSRGSNLYTILMADMMKSSPICLLSKTSKIKS